MRVFLLVAMAALSVVGCDPTIKVETPKPIAIDINMRLDVYQFDGKAPDSNAAPAGGTLEEIRGRRSNRAAELQKLKNNRVVGENHEGLLALRNPPPGPYGKYVRETVATENADRTAQYAATAKAEDKPVAAVRKNQADLLRQGSFAGEWIQVQEGGGAWIWIQKVAAAKPASGKATTPAS
ncbi:MAG: DUF1318 domain-containing protein [Candidatus Binatia bacterium]|nr:DUF1318 domain-containing protein [Candidatus Binatia bacterium]